jgi:hypothetical protein
LTLLEAVPFLGHSKGIPITTLAEDPPVAEAGETGKTEPLATTVIDAGLVIDEGTVAVLSAATPEGPTSEPAAEIPKAENKAPESSEPVGFAV